MLGTIDTQREIIRLSLDAITNDIGMALRDAGLTFRIFITVHTAETLWRRSPHPSTLLSQTGRTHWTSRAG
jgi:hypothetical protein